MKARFFVASLSLFLTCQGPLTRGLTTEAAPTKDGAARPAGPLQAMKVPAGTIAGGIEGSFSVQQGAASYQIALMVPPGTKGMQPSLNLTYRSGSGNGVVGVGFRLQGVSAITRCGADILTDGFKGGVSYDDDDRFCLGGERLIEVGSSGTSRQYRTQKESWQRIVSNGTCGSGPCSFTLDRGDGTVMSFGTNDLGVDNQSAVAATGSAPSGSIREWLQDTTTDANGNGMSFKYTSSPHLTGGTTSDQSTSGQIYLDNIQYWPEGAPATDARTIAFFYELRDDPLIQYLGGGAIRTNLRLAEITTKIHPAAAACGGDDCPVQEVMSYRLGYEQSTKRSRLQSVSQCGASGDCLAPTLFRYSAGGDQLSPQQSGSAIAGNRESYLGDFNGDGRTDILVTTDQGDTLYTAQQPPSPPGFDAGTPAGTTLLDFVTRNFGDFNGDGITDVYAGDGHKGGTLYLGEDSSFTAYPLDSQITGGEILSGDFNGDGRTDLLVASHASATSWLSQGTSFDACPRAGYPHFSGTGYVADFSGDGRDDVLAVDAGGTGTLYLATSDGCSATPAGPIDNLIGKHNWVADWNGDGLADFMVGGVTTVTIHYGTGTSLEAGAAQTLTLNNDTGSAEPNFPGDFNGDGLVDLYVSSVGSENGAEYGYLYLGTGGSQEHGDYFECVQEDGGCKHISQQISTTAAFLGDFNGDGLTDIFNAAGVGSYFNWAVGPDGQLASRNQIADLLVAIVDGYGGTTTLTNKPLTDPSVYTVQAGNGIAGTTNPYDAAPLAASFLKPYPVKMLHTGPFVVASYRQTAAAGSAPYDYSYGYTYADAALDMLGRGWLGFETVTVSDPQLRAQTTTTYRQDFPYDGRVAERTTCETQDPAPATCSDSSEVLRSQASVTWICADSQSGTNPLASCTVDNSAYDPGATQVFYVAPQQATNQDETLGNQVVTSFSFDDWGNLELISALGDQNDSGSVPLYTCKAYLPADQESWTFGFLQYRKETSQESCLSGISSWRQGDLQLERYGYDQSTGDRTSRLRWDDQNQVWLGALVSFTDQGLVETVSELSGEAPAKVPGTTYTIAREPGFDTFVASVTSPDPGSGAGPLEKRYAFDARFGLKVAESDANGNLLNSCVDDLGRLTAVQGPRQGGAPASSNCLDAALYPYLDTAFTSNSNLVTTNSYRYAVDPSRASMSVVEEHLGTWTGDDWTSMTRILDGLGRTVAALYQDDQGNPLEARAEYLDPGHLRRHSLPAPAGDPAVWVSYAYDTLGRRQQTTRPIWDLDGTKSTTGSTWTYSSPNTVTVTQAAGSDDSVTQTQTLRFYGRQAQVHTARIGGATTTIDHDALARVTRVTNPAPRTGAAVVDRVSYDSLGRVLERGDSSSGTTTYQYDAHGTLCGVGDSLGQTVQVSWDPLRRPTSQTLFEKNPEATGDLCSSSQGPLQSTLTFTYDVASGPHATNPLGHLTRASLEGPREGGRIPAITYGYGYDSWSRPITRQLELGTHGELAFAVSYDPQGRVTARTYPELGGVRPQTRMSYWSGNGQLHQVAHAADGQSFIPWLELSRYDPYAQAQSASYGNGTSETWSYQADGLLASHLVTGGGGAMLVNEAFGWNARQSIETILDCNFSGNASQPACTGHTGTAPDDGGFQYGYDPVQRLKSVSGAMASSNCYDDAGNLTLNQGVVYGYQGNQVRTGSTATKAAECDSGTEGQVFSAQYNDNGAMTSRSTGENLETTLGLSYSVKGWLLETHLDERAHERSAYDFRGRRVLKTVYQSDGTTVDHAVVYLAPDFEVTLSSGGAAYTVYLRDTRGTFAALTEALPERDAVALVEALGLDMSIEPEALEAESRSLVLHRDQVGSTEAVTDDTGATYATVTYDPWGTPSISPPDHDEFRPLFGGKEYSSATGLYDFNARHYDSSTGRFVSADSQIAAGPLTPDGLNDYAYVLNNPVVYSDPSGHFPVKAAFDLAKISIAAVSVLTDSEEFLPAEDELMDIALQQIEKEAPRVIEGAVTDSSTSSSLADSASSASSSDSSSPGGDGCSSFVAGTEVATGDGAGRIESIEVGDEVWSYDEATGESELKPVNHLFRRVAPAVRVLTLGTSVLEATPEHRFYLAHRDASATEDDAGSWVEARDLRVGDKLLSLDGELVEVSAIERQDQPARVYNFEVEGNHNYFVGPERVLAHNMLRSLVRGCQNVARSQQSGSRYVTTLSHADDPATQYLSRRADIDPPGFVDLEGHANEYAMADDRAGRNRRVMRGAPELADLVRSDPAFRPRTAADPGTTLRMFGCSAGGCDDGLAQQLATLLGQDVMAPTTTLWVDSEGSYYPEAPGIWRTFKP